MTLLDEQLSELNWDSHDEVISFYEANRLYLDNAGLIANEDTLDELIGISLRYADALFNKSQFDKALKSIGQINELLQKFDQQHPNNSKYERHARFLKGMILGQQHNYRESYPIFRELIREDPEHHYYRVWYSHTRLGLYNWIFNGLMIFGTIVIFFDIALSLNKYWPFDPGMYGAIIIAIAFVGQKLARRYFKKRTA